MKERMIEFVLAAFDRLMDWKSRGWWTKVHESEIPNIVHVKEQ